MLLGAGGGNDLRTSQASVLLLPSSDIEDHKYAASIEKASYFEVIQGYPDEMFKPDDLVKRSEFGKDDRCNAWSRGNGRVV